MSIKKRVSLALSELIRLCISGDLSALRSYLTDSGSSGCSEVNTPSSVTGYAPIHHAVLSRRPDVIRLLVQEVDGLDIDVCSMTGLATTPLHLAAENNDRDCVTALIECNASLSVLDRLHRSPLDVAIECDSKDAIHAMRLIGKEMGTIYGNGYYLYIELCNCQLGSQSFDKYFPFHRTF